MDIFRKKYKNKEETPNRREDEVGDYEEVVDKKVKTAKEEFIGSGSNIWTTLAKLEREEKLRQYAEKASENSKMASVIPVGEAIDQYAYNDKELVFSGDYLYPRKRY